MAGVTRILRSQNTSDNFVSLSSLKNVKRKFVMTATPGNNHQKRRKINLNNVEFEVIDLPVGTPVTVRTVENNLENVENVQVLENVEFHEIIEFL